jgi:hypothetical protein
MDLFVCVNECMIVINGIMIFLIAIFIYRLAHRERGKCTTVKPVLRGHIWDKEQVDLSDRWTLKRGSIDMKFYMTVQEKCDLLIQVTAW